MIKLIQKIRANHRAEAGALKPAVKLEEASPSSQGASDLDEIFNGDKQKLERTRSVFAASEIAELRGFADRLIEENRALRSRVNLVIRELETLKGAPDSEYHAEVLRALDHEIATKHDLISQLKEAENIVHELHAEIDRLKKQNGLLEKELMANKVRLTIQKKRVKKATKKRAK
jgi:hypothetical protein